jgi:hypothetical protein
VQDERRVAEAIPYCGVNDGAWGHPDERAGDLERSAALTEGLHLDTGAGVRVRPEHPGAELEVEREHARVQPAGGGAVRIGENAVGGRTDAPGGWRARREGGREAKQTDGHGNTRAHGHDSPEVGRA